MSRKKAFVRDFVKLLLKNGTVSVEDAFELKDAFYQRAKESFNNFLLSEGLVSKDDLLETLSQYYNVPYFDATGYFFKSDLLRAFPRDFLVRNAIIPIEKDENMLIMAASDPGDQELLPKIGKYVSYDIRFKVGIYQNIIDSVREYYDGSPAS